MKARLVALAIAILTTASGPPAKIAPSVKVPPTTAGCLVVSNAFAKTLIDDKSRRTAQAALYFFLGRIDDRITAAQLKGTLEEQARLINNSNAPELMNSCLKLVQARAQLLLSISQNRSQGK